MFMTLSTILFALGGLGAVYFSEKKKKDTTVALCIIIAMIGAFALLVSAAVFVTTLIAGPII